jgi:hypothetical protein
VASKGLDDPRMVHTSPVAPPKVPEAMVSGRAEPSVILQRDLTFEPQHTVRLKHLATRPSAHDHIVDRLPTRDIYVNAGSLRVRWVLHFVHIPSIPNW